MSTILKGRPAMMTLAKYFAIAGCALIALSQPASAQFSFGQRPIYGQMPFPINRNPMIAPGLSLQQAAFNTRVLGRAYRSVPPYALGYNPYVRYASYGPAYAPGVFQPALYSGYTPAYATGYGYSGYPYGIIPSYGVTPYYGGNAYTGGYTTGGIDPLTGRILTGY
jgi:hypothetical protein